MGLLEWLATGFSLIYLILAVYNRPICFVFGMIGSMIWAYTSYVTYHLVFDAGLQIFYAIISLVGLYNWKYGDQGEAADVRERRFPFHIAIIGAGLVVSYVLYQLSGRIEMINYPLMDATTTVFLVVGTILLIYRIHSSWIYLVVADLFYLYIYAKVDAYLYVAMMIIYIVFGLWGYVRWFKYLKLD